MNKIIEIDEPKLRGHLDRRVPGTAEQTLDDDVFYVGQTIEL